MTTDRINCDVSYGLVFIDGHAMQTYAWCLTDLSPLWAPPEVRGANKILPGVTGVKPYRRRATETTFSLPFTVTGRCDAAGVLNDDPFAGLEENLAFLYTYVILPTNTGDGTRELRWHRPSGTETAADVHVLGYKLTLHAGGICLGTLEVSDPTGSIHL